MNRMRLLIIAACGVMTAVSTASALPFAFESGDFSGNLSSPTVLAAFTQAGTYSVTGHVSAQAGDLFDIFSISHVTGLSVANIEYFARNVHDERAVISSNGPAVGLISRGATPGKGFNSWTHGNDGYMSSATNAQYFDLSHYLFGVVAGATQSDTSIYADSGSGYDWEMKFTVVEPVPEPSTALLTCFGFAGAFLLRRRLRK